MSAGVSPRDTQPLTSAARAQGRTSVRSLAVELTYSCNQACAYCYNPARSAELEASLARSHAPGTDRLLARLERVLSVWDVAQVTLTGGEPLRYEGLFDVLALLKARGIAAQLVTNGTYVTSNEARRLAEAAVHVVQITLNGPNPDLHREHVGRDSFDQAVAGARALIAAGVSVTGCIVVTRRNAEHVAAIIELWQHIGASRIALSRFSPAGVSLERMQAWLPRRQDLVTAFALAQPFAERGLAVHCTVPIPECLLDTLQFAPIQFGQCAVGSPYQELALGPDGALRFCTLHSTRLAGGRDVLDLDWDLAAVPMSDEVVHYRHHLPEFCRDCSQASTCLGGCGAAEPFRSGAPRALDPLIRQYFEEQHTCESTQDVGAKRRLPRYDELETSALEAPILETSILETSILETPTLETSILETPIFDTPAPNTILDSDLPGGEP